MKAWCGERVTPRWVTSDRNLRIRASQQCTRADFMPLLPKRQTHKSPHWEERTYGYRYPGSAEREPGPAVDAPDDRRGDDRQCAGMVRLRRLRLFRGDDR